MTARTLLLRPLRSLFLVAAWAAISFRQDCRSPPGTCAVGVVQSCGENDLVRGVHHRRDRVTCVWPVGGHPLVGDRSHPGWRSFHVFVVSVPARWCAIPAPQADPENVPNDVVDPVSASHDHSLRTTGRPSNLAVQDDAPTTSDIARWLARWLRLSEYWLGRAIQLRAKKPDQSAVEPCAWPRERRVGSTSWTPEKHAYRRDPGRTASGRKYVAAQPGARSGTGVFAVGCYRGL